MPRENKMARTKLLTNIIQRKMMVPDEMSHSNLHHNFEISLYDFANHEILEKLYKAALYTTNFTEPLSYQDSAFLKLPKFP